MKTSGLAVTVVLVVVASIIGFTAGRYQALVSPKPLPSPSANLIKPKKDVASSDTSQYIQSSSLFANQSAVIQGSVTKLSGNVATVQATNGKSGDFVLAPIVSIYKYPPGVTQARVTNDPKDIDLGKAASVILDFKDSQYQIVSVTYSTPPVTPSPTSKP